MSIWSAVTIAAGVLGLLGLLWWLTHPSPRLVVGKRGILLRGRGWGWIPWDEVEGAYPPSADRADTVRLRLEVNLDLTETDLTPAELLQKIQTHRP